MKAERIKTTLTEASTVQVPARMPAWVVPLVKTGLVIIDLALAFAAFAYAFHLRQGGPLIHTTANGVLNWTRAFAPYGALLVLVVPIRVITLAYYDLYRLRGEFS